MKIIHIITGLSIGGAEIMLYKLLSITDKQKFTPIVIALVAGSDDMKDRIEELDIPVYSLGIKRSSIFSLFRLLKLIKLMREHKPDIIQGWMYHGNLAATFVSIFATGHPAVVWNIRHSLYDLYFEKRSTRWVIQLNRLFSRIPKAIIYNSNLSRKQHEEFGYNSHRSQMIPNGIELQKFVLSSERIQNIRSSLNIPFPAIVVGHVARFHPMKDHKGFLQAAVGIAQKHLEVHFVLVGRDITLRNQILSDLIPAEMNNRFHFLGERNDVPELMGAADLFCLSSAWGEGWPNVLGEAMAAGIPCVSTDVGDSKLIVGDTGIIVPPRDSESLMEGIEKLVKMPPAQRQALGEKARTRIIANYDLDKIVDQYASLYSELLAL